MTDGTQVEGSLFLYAPNKGGAIFFTVAFFVTAVVHLWQCQHYKSWKITSLYPFTGLIFTAGFACRSYGAFHFDNIPVYIASQCLIYMAPPLVELANYHVLGRVLYYVPYCTPMHPGRVLTTFGTLSAVVEILNAIGVAWLASPGANDAIRKVGEHLSQAALVLQLVVVLSFVVLAVLFHARCRRAGVAAARGVRGPLLTLYASTALILVRTVYRVVEHFGPGPTRLLEPGFAFADLSPVWRYEAYFFAFEAALMLPNLALWNARHPRRYLPQDHHVYLAQDGATELVGPGWESGVPFWLTLVDPFGWLQCTRDRENRARGGEKTAFWEDSGYARKMGAGAV